MSFGFGILRLSSFEFWSMTPRELAAAMPRSMPGGVVPPDRSTLEALMTDFPD
jgi:uncharacterized phage protein (TIGR02216 family)